MKYSYKLITRTDVELLRGLLQVFAEVFEEPQTYLGAVLLEEYLRGLLKKNSFIAVVALADDAVMGGLVA